MTLLPKPELPEGLPKAYDGCTCHCHQIPFVWHCVACCGSGMGLWRLPGYVPNSEPSADAALKDAEANGRVNPKGEL